MTSSSLLTSRDEKAFDDVINWLVDRTKGSCSGGSSWDWNCIVTTSSSACDASIAA